MIRYEYLFFFIMAFFLTVIAVFVFIFSIVKIMSIREEFYNKQGTHGSPALADAIEAKPRGTLSDPPSN